MSDEATRFKAEANSKRTTFIAEVAAFVIENKMWWLTPVIAALLLVGLLVALGGSGAAPFIYTLF